MANASAFTLRAEERRWPRALTVLGFLGCLLLGASLPAASVIGGSALLGAGAIVWLIRAR